MTSFKTSFKKMLSYTLIIVLLVGTIQVNALNMETTGSQTTFSDMPDNWSTAALMHAVENGLLVGSGGKILPNDYLTRAQMAAVIVRAFNASDKADLSGYSDVKPTDWFADSMAQAHQMGVMQGSNGKMYPSNFITRQEVCAVMARAFKLEPEETINKTFTDEDKISDWAKGEVYAVVNGGYIQGNNGVLDPLGYVTRAQFAQIFYNFIKQYIRTPGEYTEVADGNIMINVPEVILKDVKINGDLIIGDGVGNGDVTLDNVLVAGRMVIRGGGINSIRITGNSNIKNIIVARVDGKVRVFSEDGTEIGEVIVDGSDDVIIEGNVSSLTIRAENVKVEANNAEIGSVAIEGQSTDLVVGDNSAIENLTVNANNANITASEGSEIESVVVNKAGANIEGDGKVEKVAANADDVVVKTINTSVSAAEGTKGVKAGDKPVEPGQTVKTKGDTPAPSGGGGGGGGGRDDRSPVAITDINVKNATTVTFKSNAAPTKVLWNGTDVKASMTGSNPYTITVPGITKTSNTLVVGASGYKDKTVTYTIPAGKYENLKVISNSEELDSAITSQKDGETWILKAGDYAVESKYRFDIDVEGDSKYNYYYFPIIAADLKIIGEGNPAIYGTTLTLNGVRATQNFITIMSDGVIIDGLTIMSKISANKAIEVAGDKGGRNFTIRNCFITQNTKVTYNGTDVVTDYFGKEEVLTSKNIEFPGSLYFYEDVGNSVVENVFLNKSRISAGTLTPESSLTLKDVIVDFNGSVEEGYKGYYPISTSDRSVNVVADNVTVKVGSSIGYKLEEIINNLPEGTTLELAAGVYYNSTGEAPDANGVNIIDNGATFAKADKVISDINELSAAIKEQNDDEIWLILAGTYDIPRDMTTLYSGQAGWYMPITTDNLTIIGIGNPILTSSETSPNGAWASQNLITIWGDNVTLKGLVITPKVKENKSVEVVGDKKITIADCKFIPNTIAEDADSSYGGSLYFNGAGETGTKSILIENNTFDNASIAFDGVEGSAININNNIWNNIRGYAIGNTYWGSSERITTQYADVNISGNNFNNVTDTTKIIAARLNQTFILDDTNMVNGAQIDKNNFSNHINFNNLAYWIECKDNKVIVDDVTYESPYRDVDAYVTSSSQLIEAVNNANDGDIIYVAANEYKLTEQLKITKPLTIEGLGTVIIKADNASWGTSNESKHLVTIYVGTAENPVTISNVTFDSNNQSYGVNTYNNAYGVLNNVEITNSKGAGLTVNGSTIVANNLETHSNSWGGVNVDPGSGIITPSVFLLNSGSLDELKQIWSDGKYVSDTATVTVEATGYDKYSVGGEQSYIWSNRPLAYNKTQKTYHLTIQSAIDEAEQEDTILIPAGTFELTSTLKIDKNITVEGVDKETVILKGSRDIGSTVQLSNGATLRNVTVTRDNSGVWESNNNNNLVSFGHNLSSETTLENCIIKEGRNGVQLNNTSNAVIKGNLIDNNRTGIQMQNQVKALVENNVITNNHTIGVLLQHLSSDMEQGTPIFINNIIKDNWYSDFENRWGTEYVVNLDGNTFTDTTYMIADNSGEPGYADLHPVELGGNATRPDKRVTFVEKLQGNIIFSNLESETDLEDIDGEELFHNVTGVPEDEPEVMPIEDNNKVETDGPVGEQEDEDDEEPMGTDMKTDDSKATEEEEAEGELEEEDEGV